MGFSSAKHDVCIDCGAILGNLQYWFKTIDGASRGPLCQRCTLPISDGLPCPRCGGTGRVPAQTDVAEGSSTGETDELL